MLKYILKRIALFIPTLLITSIVIFLMSKASEGDVVLRKKELITQRADIENIKQEWIFIKKENEKLNFHLPRFFFSIYRKSSSDTLHLIPDERIRENLEEISYQTASWELTQQFYNELKELLFSNKLSETEKQILLSIARKNQLILLSEPQFKTAKYNKLHTAISELKAKRSAINNYLLSVKWHGLNNQYYYWVSSLFKGELGNSYSDGRSVNAKISTALFWTILMSILSVLLAFIIAFPSAIYAAQNSGSKIDRFLSALFYAFYSLPNFFVATLLILVFAGGGLFYLFPAYGLGNLSDTAKLWETFSVRTAHLILPLICLSYRSIAILFKQFKSSLINQLKQDYVITAKAKGLSKKVILRKQVIKNASFPLITLLGGILPSIISGSFVIEYIFSIPGMGKLTIDAFLARDFPMIFSILMLSAIVGMLGVLLADVLYFINDPRLNFSSSNQNEKK